MTTTPMAWLDWLIVAIPLVVILYIGYLSEKYIRGVSDFLAAGRKAGRYLLTVSDGTAGMGLISVCAMFEQNYKCGYALGFWNNLVVLVGLVMTLTGFVTYRFRETRALTMAEFFQKRYNRGFRIFAGTLAFISGVINYNSMIVAIAFSVIGYYFIDIIIMLKKKERDSEICVDLMHVTSSICLQLSAGVSLKSSLKKQYENCKNKDMRKSFLEFSTKYELSELNIVESTKVLSDKYDILEMNMFCRALETYNETTRIEDVLDNLYQMLKKRNVERIKQNTLTKVLYITFGVVTALGNIILIIFYPLFLNIGQGFNSVFK